MIGRQGRQRIAMGLVLAGLGLLAAATVLAVVAGSSPLIGIAVAGLVVTTLTAFLALSNHSATAPPVSISTGRLLAAQSIALVAAATGVAVAVASREEGARVIGSAMTGIVVAVDVFIVASWWRDRTRGT